MDPDERYKMSVSSLHLSALDIVTHNLDKSQVKKHKDKINN